MADGTQDPTNAEQQTSVTLEQLQQVLGGFKDEISKMVTGAVQKSHKSLEGKLNDTVKAQLTSVLDEVIPSEGDGQQQQVAQPQTTGEAEQQPQAGDDIAARLQAMLQAQTQQMEQKLSETTKQYEERIQAMQQAVEQERLNTAKAQARTAALDPIRDRLHNPDLAWAYLESKGVSYDPEKGGYGVAGKDEFQNPTFTPLSEQLSSLEKEAGYLFKPRPGTGTGTQPGTQQPASSGGSGIYADGGDAQARIDALKKSADPFAAIAENVAKASAQ